MSSEIWKVNLTLGATNYPLQPCVTSHALDMYVLDFQIYEVIFPDGVASDQWNFQQQHFSICLRLYKSVLFNLKSDIVYDTNRDVEWYTY